MPAGELVSGPDRFEGEGKTVWKIEMGSCGSAECKIFQLTHIIISDHSPECTHAMRQVVQYPHTQRVALYSILPTGKQVNKPLAGRNASQSLCVEYGRNVVDHRDRQKLHSEASRQSLSALVEFIIICPSMVCSGYRSTGFSTQLLVLQSSYMYLCKYPDSMLQRCEETHEVESI